MPTSSTSAGGAPVPPRLDALDLLRGAALFGILLVNLPFFANPVQLVDQRGAWPGRLDQLASWVVAFGFQGKFFVLFSFVFGCGVAIQLASAARRGADARARYARRLLGLFAFGVVHATCLFVGDILVSYALLGVCLWWCRDWPPRRLARAAVVLLVIATLSHAILAIALGSIDASSLAREAAESVRRYRGSFGDAVAQRLHDLPLFYTFTPFFNWPTALAMFVLGLAAGKVRLFEALPRHLPRLQRLAVPALLLGAAGSACYASFVSVPADAPTAHQLVAVASFTLLAPTAPLFTFAMAVGLVTLARHPRWQRWLTPVRDAGRMSLTNYLGQAIIASLLFNGYGLGWFGRTGPAALVGIAVAIYLVQLAVSAWWLRHFRLGPDEWLLRCLTNWRLEPIRRAPGTSTTPAATS